MIACSSKSMRGFHLALLNMEKHGQGPSTSSNITKKQYQPSKCFTKKRLRDGTIKKYCSTRKIRKSLDVPFENEDEKLKFNEKLKLSKEKLDCETNEALFSMLFDCVLCGGIPENEAMKSIVSGTTFYIWRMACSF